MRDYYAESLTLMEKTAPHQREMQFIKVRVPDKDYCRETRLLTKETIRASLKTKNA